MLNVRYPSSPLLGRLLDRVDQVLLVGLFAWMCVRLLPDGFPPQHWYSTMLIISEGIVVLFVLARRPTEKITMDPLPWMVALGGTTAVLLVENTSEPFLPGIGLVFLVVGAVLHIAAKLSLRRSFGIVAADRGIKTGGLYRFVRHPMYLGYMISHIGFLLSVPSLWNAMVYVFAWLLFVIRMRDEESLLLGNDRYAAYARTVRYRLVPGLW